MEDPTTHVSVGQELDFEIIKLNLLERKIGLSLKALVERGHRETWSYRPEVGKTSIGELAGSELGGLKQRAIDAARTKDD